jgi:hypothetical protein
MFVFSSVRLASILTVLSSLLLSACGGSSTPTCVDPDEPYLAARNLPPLRSPEGLAQPDGSSSMKIPPDTAAKQPQPERTTCLDEPPSYFRSSGTVARSPEEVIASWAQAWANREADAVVALYSSSFVAPTDSAGSAAWLEQRREQVATGPVPDPRVEALKVESDGQDRRVVSFVQKFGTNSLRRELVLVREVGSWRIVSEKAVEMR